MTIEQGKHRGIAPKSITESGNQKPDPSLPVAGAVAGQETSVPRHNPIVEGLLQQVEQLCTAYAKGHLAQVAANDTTDEANRNHYQARSTYWSQSIQTRYQNLAATLVGLLPIAVQVEQFCPVRPLPNGFIELRVHDQFLLPVVVRLTAEQALAVSMHLTTYSAISLDRVGKKPTDLLPSIRS